MKYIAQRPARVSLQRLAAFFIGASASLMAAQVSAGDSSDLELAVSDVFPVMRADLGFTDDPNALLLAQASNETDLRKAWESARPPTDEFDWVQMTSGEWLKGELKVLYDGSLEFDSDEFDLQTLDWDDVAQVYGHGPKRLSVETPEGLVTVVGETIVTRDKVLVETEEGRKEFDRGDLISITPGATSEWDNWSADINFGLTFTRGNSKQADFTAKINIERRTPENRVVADYLGNMTVANDEKTVNNHRFNTYFDMFLAKRYFFRPIFFEYYRDPISNIDYRMTIGVGGGYHIIDTPKTTWDVSGGPGFRATRYESVAPGDSQKVTTPALVIGTLYDTSLTKTVDFNGQYTFSIVNEESGTYTHHAIATFEIDLTEIFDFDISFVWDRVQDPQTRADGSTPKQDDFQLLLTLGVDI